MTRRLQSTSQPTLHNKLSTIHFRKCVTPGSVVRVLTVLCGQLGLERDGYPMFVQEGHYYKLTHPPKDSNDLTVATTFAKDSTQQLAF